MRKNGEIISKLFKPLRDSKVLRWVSFRAVLYPFISGFTVIALVEIMRKIVEYVEAGNVVQAKQYLWYFIILACIPLTIRVISKNRGFPEFRPKGYHYFYKKYLSKYVTLDNNSIEKLGTGRAQHIINTGIRSWIFVMSNSAIKLSNFISKIFFGVLFVFTVDIYYGLLFLLLAGIIVYVYVITQSNANVLRRRIKEIYIELSRDVVRIIMSKFEVLQSGKLKKDLKRYDGWLQQWLPVNRGIETQRLISEALSIVLIDGVRVLAIISVTYGLFNSYLSIADFVSIVMIAVILDDITYGISRYYIDVSKEFINIEKLRDLFDGTAEIDGYEEGNQFEHKNGDIELVNMTFGYDDNSLENTIFRDFNMKIKGGEKTALVGISGSGKSTLVKLIAGYLKPLHGSVVIDEQKLSSISLKSYYNHIGYLTQDPSVFDGTIIDNLTYSINEEVSEEQVKKCIKLAKCEFIWDFDEGVNTEIGERGIRLSGGQRQRIAIAKIFLKNPEIIILDEPTSALDSFSEESITEAMHNLFENRTVIIIAHRLQTVKNADDIIVLDEGEIVERGTHKELVEQGGSYAKMLELQSGF